MQLLRPHQAERTNMAPSVNRSLGAMRQKTRGWTEWSGVGGGAPGKNLARDGSQWASFGWWRGGEAERLFSSLPPSLPLASLFLHGEQVGRLEPDDAADTTTKGQL